LSAKSAPPRLRRAYFECRYGQLHLHNAIPAGGGFHELTSVICLHGTGQTGRAFAPLLQVLGTERSVYALDLPGSGESDPAPEVEPEEAALQVVCDFIDAMRIRTFDLLASGSGCRLARRISKERATAVRRLVLLAEAEAGVLSAQPTLSISPAEVDAANMGARVITFLARTAG
jgi:pimeloyl-ACP methyl ester carboxylesterase